MKSLPFRSVMSKSASMETNGTMLTPYNLSNAVSLTANSVGSRGKQNVQIWNCVLARRTHPIRIQRNSI